MISLIEFFLLVIAFNLTAINYNIAKLALRMRSTELQ